MTEAVFQFKSIHRKLNRLEQKAEYEAKNPVGFIRTIGGDLVSVDDAMPRRPYGVAVPLLGAAPQCKRPTTDLAEWVKPFCAKTNLRSVVGDLRTELELLERLERAVIKI
jgi:hypothetical protein